MFEAYVTDRNGVQSQTASFLLLVHAEDRFGLSLLLELVRVALDCLILGDAEWLFKNL